MVCTDHDKITAQRNRGKCSCFSQYCAVSTSCRYNCSFEAKILKMDTSNTDSVLTYETCFEAWIEAGDKISAVTNVIKNHFKLEDQEDDHPQITNLCKLVCCKLKAKWEKCSRSRSYFLIKERGFLASKISLPKEYHKEDKCVPVEGSVKVRGRPKKAFSECSEQTKRRRCKELVRSVTAAELKYAANKACSSAPSENSADRRPLSLQESLALCLDLGLSERKYNQLRNLLNNRYFNMFPSLYSLNQFKRQFLPEIANVSDTVIELNVVSMLNKTIESIFMLLKEEILCALSSNLFLICKWGMDGSSGHGTYKLKFDDEKHTDEYAFFIGFAPLMLVEEDSGKIVWKNPRSSSTLYCRPLKLMFSQEKTELVRAEHDRYVELFDKEIQNYTKYVNDKEFVVTPKFFLTMIDGKICDTITETNSSSTCFLCKATPKSMNDQNVEKFTPNAEFFKHGLSPLHCWIRFLECCLKLAYRLPFKVWRVTKDLKPEVKLRKQALQLAFKSRLGLIVDKPKQGFGSSNDGNTARTFFQKFKETAQITGLNEEFLSNCYTLLRLLNCKRRKIILSKFDTLAKETRDLYLKEYSWYFMPMTVHKVFVHGYDVMLAFGIPIAEMAEDCLEGEHKCIRRERLNHTVKKSRVGSNKCLINRLALLSDPLLASLRKIVSNKKKSDEDDLKEYFQDENAYEFLSTSDVCGILSPSELEEDDEWI